MDVLQKLFEQCFRTPAARIQALQGELGGSGRKIIRLANDRVSAIGILYSVREENVAFLEFSKHFRRHGLPVPEIYAEDLDADAYLEEDFGDTSLFEFLSNNRTGENIAPAAVEAYRKVVAVLPRFQIVPPPGWPARRAWSHNPTRRRPAPPELPSRPAA